MNNKNTVRDHINMEYINDNDTDTESESEFPKYLMMKSENTDTISTDDIKLSATVSSTDLIASNPIDSDFEDSDDRKKPKKIINSLAVSPHFTVKPTINVDLTKEKENILNENNSNEEDINYSKERIIRDDIEYSYSTVQMNMDKESDISVKDVKLVSDKPNQAKENDLMQAMMDAHCETVATLKCAMQDIFCKAFCQASMAATSAYSLIKRESTKMMENFKHMLDEDTVCPYSSKSTKMPCSGKKLENCKCPECRAEKKSDDGAKKDDGVKHDKSDKCDFAKSNDAKSN